MDTAEFYSGASGTTTVDANPDPAKANLRQRPLLTVYEVITPLDGNCTIFARYVELAFATQVILTSQLTRLYEREPWKARFAATRSAEPLILARSELPTLSTSITMPPGNNPLTTTEARVTQVMDRVASRGFSAERYANKLARARGDR